MKVRRLDNTEADAMAVGLFLKDTFAAEHRFGTMATTTLDLGRCWAHITRILNRGAVWVIDDDEGIAGSISVLPNQLWWSSTVYLNDGWFYVRPEKRDSRAAILLLKAASDYAAAQGLPLAITVFHAVDLVRKDAFFRRMGFEPLGGTYLKET